MQIPLQLTFRNMNASESLESYIRKRVEKLDDFSETLVSCRVVVEAPHKHQHKGRLYQARIDISLPGKTFAASSEQNLNQAHEDVYVAVRDAFDAVQRQMQESIYRQKGHIKRHEAVPYGRISELHPEGDFGRILSAEGKDIYFHRNSLLHADFDELETGMEVRFVEQQGEEGPQASSVLLIGKHHIVE
ncbi:MAG: HPF/RaiA family ribosome-associated protein [Desulfuromonadales bacterium]|nr:HPF/RaiA family ribosome-associated protein [Desulfuromonadales bacterium]